MLAMRGTSNSGLDGLAGLGSFDDDGTDFCLCDQIAIDERLRPEAPYASTIANLLHVIMNRIAGYHRAAESSLVDGHEIDERRLLEFVDMPHAKRASGLRPTFDQEHARHHRIAGEVALEIRLVSRDILDAGGRAVSVHVDDAVDKQKRIAMRQQLEDVGRFRPPQLGFCAALVHSNQLLLANANALVATVLIVDLQVFALRQLAQEGKLAKPEPCRFGRGASPPHARRHGASHVAAAGDLGAGADLDVADHTDLAA